MVGKTKPRDLVPVVLGTFALLFMLFMIYKQAAALQTSLDQITSEELAIAQAETRLQSLVQLKERAVILQDQLDNLERVLPPGPQEDTVITDLQVKANESGMHLLEIRFEQYENKQDYIEMPFKFALEGQYHGLLSLLTGLQEGPRAVLIKEIKISKGREELPEVRVDISASTFYAKE